jgi:hypothetical protein
MYKVIVVGTDGSPRAGVALNGALHWRSPAEGPSTWFIVRPTAMLGVERGDTSATTAAYAEMHDAGERICA